MDWVSLQLFQPKNPGIGQHWLEKYPIYKLSAIAASRRNKYEALYESLKRRSLSRPHTSANPIKSFESGTLCISLASLVYEIAEPILFQPYHEAGTSTENAESYQRCQWPRYERHCEGSGCSAEEREHLPLHTKFDW